MITACVQTDRDDCRFIEAEGICYKSDELPPEGTDVWIEFSYRGFDRLWHAEVWWSADTLSGRAFCLAHEV